jgi:hypothetical protein
VERDTNLRFEPTPDRLDTASAHFALKLRGGEGTRIVLRAGCSRCARKAGTSGNTWRWGRPVMRCAASGRRRPDGSNAVFNELARRSVAISTCW